MKRDREEAKTKGLDNVELNDEDYAEFKEAIENDKLIDNKLEAGSEEEEE